MKMKIQLPLNFLVGIVFVMIVSLGLIKVFVFSTPSPLPSSSVTKVASQSPQKAIESKNLPQAMAMPLKATEPPVPKELTAEIKTLIEKTQKMDHKNLLKEIEAMLNRQQIEHKAAFKSESAARAELKKMENCLATAVTLSTFTMPNEVSDQIPSDLRNNQQILMQSGCVRAAQELVKRFPSLKNDFDTRIARKASPEAMSRALGTK